METSSKRLRLKGWDYAQRASCFVTFCTHERRCILGEIAKRGCEPFERSEAHLSSIGELCASAIQGVHERFPSFDVVCFAVMPNHVHILIEKTGRKDSLALGDVIGNIKAEVTKKAHLKGEVGPLWQRGYHDHIIRCERDRERIFAYIKDNPRKWAEDRFYSEDGCS